MGRQLSNGIQKNSRILAQLFDARKNFSNWHVIGKILTMLVIRHLIMWNALIGGGEQQNHQNHKPNK